MNDNQNWPTRGPATYGDGGANAARFPTSRSGGFDGSAAGATSTLRGGVNNFVPSFGGTSSTQSTNNSGQHSIPANMASSRTSNFSSDQGFENQGLDGAFDSRHVGHRMNSTLPSVPYFGDTADQNIDRSLFQSQERTGVSARRDSFGSNGTFATQLPPSAAFLAPQRQSCNMQGFTSKNQGFNMRDISGQGLDTRNIVNMSHQNNQYSRNKCAQFLNGIEANVNGINAGMTNIRVTDTGSPSRVSTNNMPNNGFTGAHNAGRGRFDLMRNDGYPGSQPEGRSKFLADMIKRGQTEDPYDRTMSRYDTAPRMPNPTLGPARFKDSKVFATFGDTAPGNGGSSAATHVPSRDIIPMDRKKRPDWLELAVQGLMVPSLDEAFDALPLTELCRSGSNNMSGVVRVKDIPYGTTRQEMTAFIGRNAQVLRQPEGSPYHAVHILMERESGKTMDCFIEVTSPTEAAWVARQFARRVEQKRPPKVGDRCVEVLYSSQDELMVELFPRAKHVRWSNGQPVVDRSERKYYADKSAAGFQGFLHPEELVAMGKHANLSDRSPFASKSPCRVYESMITLLHKYPWNNVEEVSIAERRSIYDCATGLIKTLITDLRRANTKLSPLYPTPALLQELAAATLVCPGFTEKQKASIVGVLGQGGFESMADGRKLNIKLGGQHPFSPYWPFSALGMSPDADQDVLQYFAGLFRQVTAGPKNTSLAARKAAEASGQQENPMGNWNISYGADPASLSLAQIGKIEFDEIERILTVICEQQIQPQMAMQYNHSALGNFGRGNTSGSGTNSSGGSRQNSATFNQTFY